MSGWGEAQVLDKEPRPGLGGNREPMWVFELGQENALGGHVYEQGHLTTLE